MELAPIKIAMEPPHVGQFIRQEILEELQISITKAAEILGVRRATVSDLVNEKTGLTPEMALRMEKAFGLNMDMLLRMQAWHDTCRMRLQADRIHIVPYQPAAE